MFAGFTQAFVRDTQGTSRNYASFEAKHAHRALWGIVNQPDLN